MSILSKDLFNLVHETFNSPLLQIGLVTVVGMSLRMSKFTARYDRKLLSRKDNSFLEVQETNQILEKLDRLGGIKNLTRYERSKLSEALTKNLIKHFL